MTADGDEGVKRQVMPKAHGGQANLNSELWWDYVEFAILTFLKPLLASLGVSWSNFTSLFCDRGLIEPHLGSLGLGGEISRLFLSRHWPPLRALIRLSTPRHGIPASGKWRLMALQKPMTATNRAVNGGQGRSMAANGA